MQNFRRVGENFSPILAVSGPKFTAFWDDIGNPFYFPTHLPDCVCWLSFRRYRLVNLPFSCEVIENMSAFLSPKFLRGGRWRLQIFYGNLSTWFTSFSVAKFGWVLWSEVRMQSPTWRKAHYCRRVGENSGPILSRLWTKVHIVFRRRRN